MKDIVLSYSIKANWDYVQQIEAKIGNLFDNIDADLLDSIKMVISELIENSVKYTDGAPGQKSINFNFTADDRSILVIISNPVKNKNNVDIVSRHIKRIQDTDDPQTLYIERLQQILDNPEIAHTQLGLYRIAFEGKFKLSCAYQSNILTVKAIRKLKGE